jgi:hypothetical protein
MRRSELAREMLRWAWRSPVDHMGDPVAVAQIVGARLVVFWGSVVVVGLVVLMVLVVRALV